MIFKKQKIKGVFLIYPDSFKDKRGVFRRHFCQNEFKKNGIVSKIEQANISENKFKYTLRGFHYQTDKHKEGKTLSCIKGKIYDIVVDLRKSSPTFGQWLYFELDEKNRKSIHIPPGCANAFLTLKNDSIIHYYCSKSYAPKFEKGIRFNDKFFNFKWPRKPKIVSIKDLNHLDFKITNSIK
jgi:dTDP-4-dehydrorhamnose 3,5-epimerase